MYHAVREKRPCQVDRGNRRPSPRAGLSDRRHMQPVVVPQNQALPGCRLARHFPRQDLRGRASHAAQKAGHLGLVEFLGEGQVFYHQLAHVNLLKMD